MNSGGGSGRRSVVHHCNPSPNPPQKNRLSLDPRTDPRSVGQTTVRGSRPLYPAFDANDGRPARTVIRSMARRSHSSITPIAVKSGDFLPFPISLDP
ncbi:hypothetical protein MTR67_001497 [Solanum verrucosum]|uniref:Uncharacterized protein n=1 Tax=Solanum verrucosum TaxID=315347 RepID=A0AAF0PNR3_SOLVR|nr:hypothetical protein MTR67_001497 [Solanum verrucosum]